MKLFGRGSTGLLTALLLLTSGCGQKRPLAEGMNVLLVTLDTTRADYASPFGGEAQNTPRLHALAERSGIFTQAVSETNFTCPSHLTIMSGLGMNEHGLTSNHGRMPEGVDILAEAMKRAGYRAAGFPAARHVARRMGRSRVRWCQPPRSPLHPSATSVTHQRDKTGHRHGAA